MKQVIIDTLNEVSADLESLQDDYFIIGGAALFLLDVPIKRTHDIDILCSKRDAASLCDRWARFKNEDPNTTDDELFKSDFHQFVFPNIEVEVQGELMVKKGDVWVPIKVESYQEVKLDKVKVKVPTLAEMLRILRLFGRPKDLKRISFIEQYLATKA